MKVSEFDHLLGSLGVHRREWRERLIAEVCVMIGNAQMRAFGYGALFGAALFLAINWVMVNP